MRLSGNTQPQKVLQMNQASRDKPLNLEELVAQHDRARQEADNLGQQISKARLASAASVFDQVIKLLSESGRYFSAVQKNRIARLMKPEGQAKAAPGRKSPATRGNLPAKFQLDTGETWTGMRRKNNAFNVWAASKAGKAWRAANPGQQYPSYPNVKFKGTVVVSKPAKKASKKSKPTTTKKTAKKASKKTTKKTAKKAVRKNARKKTSK